RPSAGSSPSRPGLALAGFPAALGSPRRTLQDMRVIDSQTHWYPRFLWEAYTELSDYPRCRRDGDGYAFELAPDRWFPIRPHFYELDLQLETFDAAGIDAVVSSSASFGDVDRLPVGRAKEVAYALNEAR